MSCCVENHCHDGDCCICADFPLTCDLCKAKADIELPDGRVLCSDHYDETTEGETPVTEFVQQMIPTNEWGDRLVVVEMTAPAPRLFPARFDGACRTCPDTINAGDLIRRVDVGSDNFAVYVHADCPDPTPEPDPLATYGLPLCTDCFCYHKGDCP